MFLNGNSNPQITVNDQPLEEVDDFTYLGSVMSKDYGTSKDIKARLAKACSAFSRLNNIWKSKEYSLKTKVKIYNSLALWI